MKLYLAAPYAGRDTVRNFARFFTAQDHVITSGWLQATRAITFDALGTAPAQSRLEVAHHAKLDLCEVEEADVLVHWTASFLQSCHPFLTDGAHKLHSGGRHVETGYALALQKPIIIIGEPENIFQRGLGHLCPTISDALDVLDDLSTTP